MMSESMCKSKYTISMYDWLVSEKVSKDDAGEDRAHYSVEGKVLSRFVWVGYKFSMAVIRWRI